MKKLIFILVLLVLLIVVILRSVGIVSGTESEVMEVSIVFEEIAKQVDDLTIVLTASEDDESGIEVTLQNASETISYAVTLEQVLINDETQCLFGIDMLVPAGGMGSYGISLDSYALPGEMESAAVYFVISEGDAEDEAVEVIMYLYPTEA